MSISGEGRRVRSSRCVVILRPAWTTRNPVPKSTNEELDILEEKEYQEKRLPTVDRCFPPLQALRRWTSRVSFRIVCPVSHRVIPELSVVGRNWKQSHIKSAIHRSSEPLCSFSLHESLAGTRFKGEGTYEGSYPVSRNWKVEGLDEDPSFREEHTQPQHQGCDWLLHCDWHLASVLSVSSPGKRKH